MAPQAPCRSESLARLQQSRGTARRAPLITGESGVLSLVFHPSRVGRGRALIDELLVT